MRKILTVATAFVYPNLPLAFSDKLGDAIPVRCSEDEPLTLI